MKHADFIKKDDDFDWEEGDSNIGLLGLGPSVDHTFGNQNGHYIFIGNLIILCIYLFIICINKILIN